MQQVYYKYAKLKENQGNTVKIELSIPLTGSSMLKTEEIIQNAVNEAGAIATGQAIKNFDSDGAPIKMGNITFYSKKEKVDKIYETPYASVNVQRYVYQSSKGGETFCPLDQKA